MAKLVPETSPPVPEFVTHLVELFEARAADLRFPGVDAARLRSAVKQTEEHSSKIVELRAALQEALESLTREQQNLLHLARQAHAYLSVFAQGEPEILDQLKAIPFGDAEKTARRTRQRSTEMTPPPGSVEEETAAKAPSPPAVSIPSASAKLAATSAAQWVQDAAPADENDELSGKDGSVDESDEEDEAAE